MHRRPARALLLAVLSSGLAAVATAHDPIDLGTLPGYTASRAKDVNERGDIVGQAVRAGAEPVEQAVLWDRTHVGRYVLEALPALPGLVRGDARGFANGRAPIGFSYLVAPGLSHFRAVVWREDPSGEHVPLDLAPPPGFTDATALGANPRGQIAGTAQNPLEVINGSTVQHAVLWRPVRGDPDCPDDPPEYEVCDLGVPDGFDTSGASGINDAGDVVGTTGRIESDGSGGLFLRSAVVVWRKPWRSHRRCVSDPTVLPSPPELPLNLNPAINDRGDVVAQADRRVPGQPAVSRPLLWVRSDRDYAEAAELPLPEGFTDAFATDVNASGSVIGTALVRSSTGAVQASRAVLWRLCPRRDPAVSLLANPPGTTFTVGAHLNDRGDAVGSTPLPPSGSSGGLLWRGATHRRGHDGDGDAGDDDDRDYRKGSRQTDDDR
jgi:uncharacterized membrane protein